MTYTIANSLERAITYNLKHNISKGVFKVSTLSQTINTFIKVFILSLLPHNAYYSGYFIRETLGSLTSKSKQTCSGGSQRNDPITSAFEHKKFIFICAYSFVFIMFSFLKCFLERKVSCRSISESEQENFRKPDFFIIFFPFQLCDFLL